MIRPWYRSRVFWFGLPGFLLLIWVWGAYLRKPVSACWGTQYAQYCLGWGDGLFEYIAIRYKYSAVLTDGREQGFFLIDEPFYPEDETIVFASPFGVVQDSDGDSKVSGFSVGHWVIVALYTLVWISGLAWWQRRKYLFQQRAVHAEAT